MGTLLSFVPDAEQRPGADSDAEKVPVETRSREAAEPSRVSAGRGPYQVVEPGLGSAGR